MLHHNDWESFVLRGQRAQAAVDVVLAKHNLPAVNTAGVSEPTRAGEQQPRPRTPAQDATDDLEQIEGSNDVVYLRRIAGDPDAPLGKRRAAERRLRNLRKGNKAK